MKELEQKILAEGKVFPGNVLKVNSFLNHQIDSEFMMKIGSEIAEIYKDCNVTKVLTIEASGIAIALAAAYAMKVPMVFAKKGQTTNLSPENYSSKVYSYTHGRVYDVVLSKEFLTDKDTVVIVDDFLANGAAVEGLLDIVSQSGAKVAGITAAIEKGFQDGGKRLRAKGYRVESLAVIESMTDDAITFKKQ